jgi:hypothetical protein
MTDEIKSITAPPRPQKMISIPLKVLHRLFSDLTTLHCSAAHGGRPVSIAGCDECDFICSNIGYLTGDGPMTDINKGLQLSVEMPSEIKQ